MKNKASAALVTVPTDLPSNSRFAVSHFSRSCKISDIGDISAEFIPGEVKSVYSTVIGKTPSGTIFRLRSKRKFCSLVYTSLLPSVYLRAIKHDTGRLAKAKSLVWSGRSKLFQCIPAFTQFGFPT